LSLISYIKSNIKNSAVEKNNINSSPHDELSNKKGNLIILNEIIARITKIVAAIKDFSYYELKKKIAAVL